MKSRDLPSLKKQREEKAALLSQSRVSFLISYKFKISHRITRVGWFFLSFQLFTQEEFKTIQLKQITSRIAPKRGKKRQISEMLCTQDERRQASGDILSESLIETIDHKKQKLDKEARIAAVQVCRCTCILFLVVRSL